MSNTPKTPIEMSESEFDKRFTIAEFDHGDKFETYGEELELFNREAKENPNTVWTAVDGDDGELLFVNRIAFVNRVYYFVTEEAYDPNEDIVVAIDMDFDQEEEYELERTESENLDIASILYAEGTGSEETGEVEIEYKGFRVTVDAEDYSGYIRELEEEKEYVENKVVGEKRILELAQKLLEETKANEKSTEDRIAAVQGNYEERKNTLEKETEKWSRTFKKNLVAKKLTQGKYSKQTEMEILIKLEEEELEKWKWSLERNLADPKNSGSDVAFLKEMVENKERLLEQSKEDYKEFLKEQNKDKKKGNQNKPGM